MAKRRMLHDRFWTSHNNLQWTIRQRLLFIGLISNADDQGRMKAHPALVRASVFPYDDLPLVEIEADLQAIAETGAIHLYMANDLDILQIGKWWEYQQPQWAQPSELPPPDGWQDRIRYRNDGTVLSYNWTSPSGKGGEDTCDATGRRLGNGLPKALPDEVTCSYSDSDSDSRDGADAPPPPKPPTPQQAMFEAICEVCVLDPATVAKGRVGKQAATLRKAGYTPEQVRVCYGKAGWWYQHDWRGRKGELPRPELIGETIKQAVGTDPPAERPNVRIVPQQGNHWWEESA